MIAGLKGFSQSISKLNSNYGFKEYKLESLYKQEYGNKERDYDGSDVVSIENQVDYINDIPIEKIKLFFLSDSLVRIVVFIDENQSKKLSDALIASFGKETKYKSDWDIKEGSKKPYFNKYIWIANKFTLVLYESRYPTSFWDKPRRGTISLTYELKDYEKRLERMKHSKYSSNDF
ncbi:hypothetical protein [Ferruginibacter sp.]|uniref:hypothetical protein n=1 Tax=Ferruginibacter sp. TaxID=1940288 RepID=UPI0026592353|nr:hypothetical protein [Ferruginibacter sp.]